MQLSQKRTWKRGIRSFDLCKWVVDTGYPVHIWHDNHVLSTLLDVKFQNMNPMQIKKSVIWHWLLVASDQMISVCFSKRCWYFTSWLLSTFISLYQKHASKNCLPTQNADTFVFDNVVRVLNFREAIVLSALPISKRLMPRLHMQVWQPGTERRACIKVLSCCQARAIFCLWSR